MQSELPKESPKATSESTSSSSPITTQHGLRVANPATSWPPSSEDAASPTAASVEQVAADAALARELQDADSPRSLAMHGLRQRHTPSPPARNRVTEYEQASTPPSRKREGPALGVISRHHNSGDKRSLIQTLPNEVLIHALAHLAPADLASISLVSKRFHELVTGPHAWRGAFAHFFPGAQSLEAAFQAEDADATDVILSEKRAFTRLTPLASWRSEYIMRTRLLRSLARGKPVQAVPTSGGARSGHNSPVTPIVMYNSQLFTTVNHLHATFYSGTSRRCPRFVHGADDVGTATRSDPETTKVDNWGLADHLPFMQFADRFPGDEPYGLGPGEIIGVPNVMDVSQPYGMVHGEGFPGGVVYYRSSDEMRGRFLLNSSDGSAPEMGVPRIPSSKEAITAVWIARSTSIPSMTEGLIGVLSGSSLGVLTAYSLGSTGSGNNRDHRFARGQMTARWVLSPGVPIISIVIDNEYSLTRYTQNRIWAVVLNALGEVFYLTKFPKRMRPERDTSVDEESLSRAAWLAGRSVYWNQVEPSRRAAKFDPYADSSVDGSYSPRSSWDGMCLSKEQVQSETYEIEAFALRKPIEFQKSCIGWDMRRKLEVDFAGDGGNNDGENIVVFECGLEDGSTPAVKRYTRCRVHESFVLDEAPTPSLTTDSTGQSSPPSLFGGGGVPSPPKLAQGPVVDRLEDSLGQDDFSAASTPRPLSEEWRTSSFTFHGLKHVQILATTLDNSTFATQTRSEDALLNFSVQSTSSSPSLTPLSPTNAVSQPNDIPGQRARLIAAGTQLGTVMVWNVRAPLSRSTQQVNTVDPVRIIHTDSPQIACLGLTSLYLVHGGNDGLVQAWDPLASNLQPIRTLNSRFSSRARRRLAQAQASPEGVGINLFAAGAICLDPDPTVLRGMVSLGTHLRYWSYSSSAADQYKSHKRRLRRSERGSNNGGERFSGAVRSNLKEYIASERFELDREIAQRDKEAQRFAGRFGTELLDGSEEEMMAYAAMLSQESLEQENRRRASATSPASGTALGGTDQSSSPLADTPSRSTTSLRGSSTPKTNDELDADIAEAIRQSLASSPPADAYDNHLWHVKPRSQKSRSSAKASPEVLPLVAGSSNTTEMSDLDFALQLSIAEEQSRESTDDDPFPRLASSRGVGGKGKGRLR